LGVVSVKHMMDYYWSDIYISEILEKKIGIVWGRISGIHRLRDILQFS
jgi:hypothetical protein